MSLDLLFKHAVKQSQQHFFVLFAPKDLLESNVVLGVEEFFEHGYQRNYKHNPL